MSEFKAPSSEEVTASINENGENIIPSPIQLPDWLCIFLPCLKNLPVMIAYRKIQSDSAILWRTVPGRPEEQDWVGYDSDACIINDTIKLTPGTIIPADMLVSKCSAGSLVDSVLVTGESSLPVTVNSTLYAGQAVKQGEIVGRVTAVGKGLFVSKLIKEGKFPAKVEGDDDEEVGLLNEKDEEKGL